VTDTGENITAAAEAFDAAARAWRDEVEGAPDLFLEATMRMAEGHQRAAGRARQRTQAGARGAADQAVADAAGRAGDDGRAVHGRDGDHDHARLDVIVGMIRECTALGVVGSRWRYEWEHAYYLRERGSGHPEPLDQFEGWGPVFP
jgi:hypothetical protein